MNGNQEQIKKSLSEQLNEHPFYPTTSQLEKISKKAMKEIDKSVAVDDIDDFYQKL